MIQFLLNDRPVTEEQLDPNLTVLSYLRTHQRRCGTKEGCASGDCGACSVTLGSVVDGKLTYQTVNSCLMLVSGLQGKQLITVEDLRQEKACIRYSRQWWTAMARSVDSVRRVLSCRCSVCKKPA